MKAETTIDIELHTLRLAVSFLLAQESRRSGLALKTVQEAMVSHFISATQAVGQDHPKEALALEVAMTQSADRLFSIAATMHQ